MNKTLFLVKGRLKNVSLNYSAKFLVLLQSEFPDLVINFYHILMLHNCMKDVKLNSYKVLDANINKSSKTRIQSDGAF